MKTTMFCSTCWSVAYVDGDKVNRTCGHFQADLITEELYKECLRSRHAGQSAAIGAIVRHGKCY